MQQPPGSENPNYELQNSVILASNSVIGLGGNGGFDEQQLLSSTFDFTPGLTGANYPGGLSGNTIASMPLEDLYKRIDK